MKKYPGALSLWYDGEIFFHLYDFTEWGGVYRTILFYHRINDSVDIDYCVITSNSVNVEIVYE